MRVAIDARGVQPKLQGIGRHVLNLLFGLSQRGSDLEFVVFFNNPLAQKVIERSGGPYRGRFQWVRVLSQPGSVLEKVELPWLLRTHGVRLFHNTSMSNIWSANVPVVTTVHELGGLHFKVKPGKDELRRLLRGARLLIAVSESLADEVESSFNISRPKIRVIGNAVDPWLTARVDEKEIRAMLERFKLSGKYFLCVTADKPSKNKKLLDSAARDWIGPEQWVFTALTQKKETVSANLRHLGVVEDVWLRPLYAACSAVIVPSLYEGFSLPPLEALAIGNVPVVSDISAHRETLGSILPKSLFFDPTSEEALVKALRAATDGGDSLKTTVLEKFRAVKDRYSFLETAERIQAVYKEALRG